jgi:hypothetical protein
MKTVHIKRVAMTDAKGFQPFRQPAAARSQLPAKEYLQQLSAVSGVR